MRRPPVEKEEDAGELWSRCLREGDLEGAWAVSDRVLAGRDPAECDDPGRPYHERWVWDGTPVDGMDVLVRCYHGLGDTLQFARFLPSLRRHARHVSLEVQPELLDLLSRDAGADELIPFDVAAPVPPHCCTLEIMELAHALRADARAIREPVPYLSCPPLDSFLLPPGSDGAVSLCWQAGDWDPSRFVVLETVFAALDRAGQRFVSLQRGPHARDASAEIFVNPLDNDTNVGRTAALIAASAMVVTVDTMVAHLAGALGKRCFVLVKSEPDWRWTMRDEATPRRSLWYPNTTILDQDKHLGWAPALGQLRAALLAESHALRSA